MVKRLKFLWHAYNLSLEKRPFLTQIATAGALYATGDALCQYLMIKKSESDEKKGKDTSKDHRDFDIWRTIRFGVYGFCISGPLSYLWYKSLDKFIRVPLNASKMQMIKVSIHKVLWDELVFGPATLVVFFVGMSLLEGKTLLNSYEKCKKEFMTTLIADLIVWPGAQFINFLFLPTHYRILYISSLNLFWNAFLSNMQHHGLPGHDESDEEENTKLALRALSPTSKDMTAAIEQEIHNVD